MLVNTPHDKHVAPRVSYLQSSPRLSVFCGNLDTIGTPAHMVFLRWRYRISNTVRKMRFLLSKAPSHIWRHIRRYAKVLERLTNPRPTVAITSPHKCDLPVLPIESPHSAFTNLSYVRRWRSRRTGTVVLLWMSSPQRQFSPLCRFCSVHSRTGRLAGRRGGGTIIAGRASSRSAVAPEFLPGWKQSWFRLFSAQKTQQRCSSSDLPAHGDPARVCFFYS